MSFVRAERASLSDALEKSLHLIDYRISGSIKKVVVKPNMCYYWDYSTGHTTDPAFVSALIDTLRELVSPSIAISIAEADASAMKCRYAFRMLGYERMAKEQDVALINLSQDKTDKTTVTVNGHSISIAVPRTISEADLRINVPKVKYMDQTKISCALKNVFGANPVPNKYRLHPRLDRAIVAINKAMKFDLHVLDGIVVPGNPPRRMNLIMSSRDPVALDAAASRMAGINPRAVRHIVLAQREGLGTIRFQPRGASLEAFARLYPRKTPSTKLLTVAYTLAIRMGLLNPNTF